MADITIDDINTLVGPCLGKYTQQLVTLMRQEHGYETQPVPRSFAAFACGKMNEHRVTPPQANQCPERFAAAALTAFGHPVNPQDIDAESAAVQARLRWHLKI